MLKRYYWKGLNNEGKPTSGIIISLSADEVRDILLENNCRMIDMNSGQISFVERKKHSLTSEDITLFTSQLGTLLSAGIPIIASLKLIAKRTSKAELRSLAYLLQTQLQSGESLTNALTGHPLYFDDLYLSLVKAGELSGNLENALKKLAEQREKVELLKSQTRQAVQYPLIMLCTIIVVCYIMLTMVIPEFEFLFRSMNTELPWITKKLIRLSNLVQNNCLVIFACLSCTAWLLCWSKKHSEKVQLKLSRWSLVIPVFGTINQQSALARFAHTLATNYRSGIPLLNNLAVSAETTGNLYIQKAILRAHQNILLGRSIHQALRDEGAFPELLLQMVMIGEQSGKLDDMLEKLAHMYDNETAQSLNSLSKLIEPILVLLLGIVIGGLVIAMYLPIFNLTSVLG